MKTEIHCLRQPEGRRGQKHHLYQPGRRSGAGRPKSAAAWTPDAPGQHDHWAGVSPADQLPTTLSDVMGKVLTDEPISFREGILHHPEGIDLMPADIQLAGMEVSLVNAMSRETFSGSTWDTLRGQYSHILLDCQPSLGMMTINALAAANRLVIPVQAEYLPAKGLEQLLKTVAKVKRNINPQLQIEGILLTMVDSRTNFAREISQLIPGHLRREDPDI